MGGYADYALATKVPALWARMQEDQAQKRTGDLAKNMFAQLDGLDPQSKEYFQRMRQLGMESGDDTLYQTGEGLNKAQQGYVFDDPMLTGHWKDFLLEGGDPNDKNAFAVWNDRRASQSGTKVNITMPGQPGFDWSSPVPMEVLEKATPGAAEFIPGMTWGEFRSSGAKMPGKSRPEAEATAAQDASLLGSELNSLASLVSDPDFNNKNRRYKDVAYDVGAAIAPDSLAPIITSQKSDISQKLASANGIIEQIVTKRFTGASATDQQARDFRNAYTLVQGESDPVRAAKLRRIGLLKQVTERLGNGLNLRNIEGRMVLGEEATQNGGKKSYVLEPNGEITVYQQGGR